MSVIDRAVKSVLEPTVGSPFGEDSGPDFNTPLTHSLFLRRGYGPPTFSRTTSATVVDFEGRLIEVKANEARFAGARRVENLQAYSEYGSPGWTGAGTNPPTVSNDTTYQGVRCMSATFPAGVYNWNTSRATNESGPSAKVGVSPTKTYRWRMKVRASRNLTGAEQIVLSYDGPGAVGKVYLDSTYDLVSDWIVLSAYGTPPIAGNAYIAIYSPSSVNKLTNSFSIYITEIQIQDVTGQTNQNPSEYVSTNVLSAPYHGAGVDGVKYFPYENGNTVDANGVVTEAQGPAISSTTLKGIHREGQRTNSLLYCRDLSNAVWSNTNTPVITQNQVGIDGVANTAWTIEDDGATIEYIYQTLTIPDDSNTHTLSVFIKKDNDETRFPEIQCVLKGGTTSVYHIVQVNTKTGAYYNRINTNSDLTEIEDWGDWWRVKVNATNNSSGNTSLQVSIYPAVTTTWGTTESAATGSIVIDWPQVELNSSFPSSPIYTEGTAVTRSSDILTYPDQIPYGTASYTLYAEVEFVTSFPAPSHFLRRDSFGPWTYTIFGYNGPTGFTIAEYDGSMGQSVLKAVTITGGQMYRVISRKNSNYTVGYDGSLSSGGSVISPRLATEMYVGSSSAGNALYGYIKNIKIWRKALSDAQLVRETS